MAFGGASNINGDPNGSGSHGTSARTAGVAAGVDYKLSPDTMLGFALAGGGTGWGLSQGLGGVNSDAFQAGLYGSQRFGPWYVSAAGSFANYWMATSRTVTIPATETLDASFIAQSWGARAEAGYKLAWAPLNLTPYAAFQTRPSRHLPTAKARPQVRPNSPCPTLRIRATLTAPSLAAGLTRSSCSPVQR